MPSLEQSPLKRAAATNFLSSNAIYMTNYLKNFLSLHLISWAYGKESNMPTGTKNTSGTNENTWLPTREHEKTKQVEIIWNTENWLRQRLNKNALTPS